MKLIYSNMRKGEVKIRVESLDDLWYLSNLIDEGDLVKGRTLRKIKIGEEGARKQAVIKKPVFIAIKVEKAEFSKTSDVLRVLGTIVEGPEDIPRGEHHSFNVEIGSIIELVKEKWLRYQLDKLKEACSEEASRILICILDRESALFALSKKQGYDLLGKMKGEVEKKAVKERIKAEFYLDVIKTMQEYIKRYKIDSLILASPSFWKEDLVKQIKDDELKKKIVLATCSSEGEEAINEVLKRKEVQTVLKKDRIAKEMNLVEELLVNIAKNALAAYGIQEVENAANMGAVKILIVADSLIRSSREEKTYDRLDTIMKTVDSAKGEVHIISSDHDGGKRLNGLGGIGAVLRYRIS
ncbi:MAG: mRNA surveillance protein pelota [Candidatus Woesearchaeota archaeon]|nr:mRNA surveillance protein pelota [Candidatus Woesearchaeota archaeon]